MSSGCGEAGTGVRVAAERRLVSKMWRGVKWEISYKEKRYLCAEMVVIAHAAINACERKIMAGSKLYRNTNKKQIEQIQSKYKNISKRIRGDG